MRVYVDSYSYARIIIITHSFTYVAMSILRLQRRRAAGRAAGLVRPACRLRSPGEFQRIHVYIHVYIYVCVYMYIQMYVCLYTHMYLHVYIYIHTHKGICVYIYMWPRLLGPIQLIVHIILYEPKVESYLKIYVPMLSFVLQRSRTPVGAIKLFVICDNNKLLPGGRWRTRINIYNVSSSLISLNLFATLYAPVLS